MKSNRALFTIPPTEHYHLVQHELRQVEDKLVPVIQRILKRMYPELLDMIPKDIEKSKKDDDYYLYFEGKEIPLRELHSLLGKAAYKGIQLGGSELWDRIRSQKGTPIDDFDNAFNPDEIWSTNNDALIEHSRMTIQEVSDTLKEDTRLYLKRALGEGLTYKDMAQGLKDLLGYDDSWRAVRVARTEANWAANQGIANAANSLGINQYTVNLSPDACEYCQDAFIGVTLDQDEVDRELPNHPNCRCTAAPTIPNDWNIEDYM